MVAYIDAHREEFGVESICNELPIAPSTYHDFKQRQPSARAQRDAVMLPIVMALFVANYRVYGARKLWIAARRAGHDIGRDQVARLMTILDIHGVTRRRKRVWTTRSDGGPRSPDLVDRDFTAEAPNQLWVTDLTYVPTWSGVAVRGVHRRCVLEDDRWLANRGAHAHRDAPRCAEHGGLEPASRSRRSHCASRRRKSVHIKSMDETSRRNPRAAIDGNVGDSYDNAPETDNGYYKAELIYGPAGPWKTVDDVELATLAWVDWHNTERLDSFYGLRPAEFEANYAADNTDELLVMKPIIRISSKPRAIHRPSSANSWTSIALARHTDARYEIMSFIDWYNHRRRHTSLDGVSPFHSREPPGSRSPRNHNLSTEAGQLRSVDVGIGTALPLAVPRNSGRGQLPARKSMTPRSRRRPRHLH